MIGFKDHIVILFVLLGLLIAFPAHATMLQSYSFTGTGAGLSVDAVGMGTRETATVSAEIPANAIIQDAFLYSASIWSGSLYDVSFEGTTLISDASSRLDTGVRDANVASENKWNVKSQVNAAYDGIGGTYNFDVEELGNLDGEILSVIYSVPNQPVRTSLILDGELATSGDTVVVSFTEPYDGTDVPMSLGISYSYQGYQYTKVDINGNRLTSGAGHRDDGYSGNGGLITAGGVGDDLANPSDPFANTGDDELYNLATFLDVGDTGFTIDTRNPSGDDNVFFMGLNVNGEASANGPAPVPEPATMVLLGAGLLGVAAFGRKKVFNKA